MINLMPIKWSLKKKRKKRYLYKNDHRSGGAVKDGCPYICIKHIIKLKKKKYL